MCRRRCKENDSNRHRSHNRLLLGCGALLFFVTSLCKPQAAAASNSGTGELLLPRQSVTSSSAAAERRIVRRAALENPSGGSAPSPQEQQSKFTPSANNGQTANSRRDEPQQAANETNAMTVHEREFSSPQVRVQMDCQKERTLLRVNFTRPFNGFLGAGKLETTKCKVFGSGAKYYELKIKHNSTECDSQWDQTSSSISNTLFIRFHTSLETGNDIAKNIMCRLAVGDLIVGRKPLAKQPKAGGGLPKRLLRNQPK